jgi:hypothetical protein
VRVVVIHERRAVAGGRREIGKRADRSDLRCALGRWNLTAPIASRPAPEIDNSTLPAEAVARRIAAHVALSTTGGASEGGCRA